MENTFWERILDNIVSRIFVVFLGLIATGITIYAFFIEQNVKLNYEVVSNTNVLDFNAELSKLEVFYDSTNLKQTQENLKVITIKVVNKGEKDLLKSYYDENEPLGLIVKEGQIIEIPELIETSSDYLKQNVVIQKPSLSRLEFSNVILETDEYFTFKLLVLHKKSETPNLYPIGKIAGQKQIEILQLSESKASQNFFSRTFEGDIWIQLVRLVFYFLAVVLAIVAIALLTERINSYRSRKRKKSLINRFKNSKSYEYTRMDDAIFDRYLNEDTDVLKRMSKLIEDEQNLNKQYAYIKKRLRSKEYRRYRRLEYETRITAKYNDFDLSVFKEMQNDGIVFEEGDRLIINQAMKDTLNKFIDFLKSEGEYKLSRRYPMISAEVDIDDIPLQSVN